MNFLPKDVRADAARYLTPRAQALLLRYDAVSDPGKGLEKKRHVWGSRVV